MTAKKRTTTKPKMAGSWRELRDLGFDVRLVQGSDENGIWRVRGFGADVHVAGETALEVEALTKLATHPKEDSP